jgi:hypothetical protein
MATLTIDPEVDDYQTVLGLIATLYGVTEASTEDDVEAEAAEADISAPVDGFTPQRMRRYVRNLTPDGQRVLRYLAENAPTVEMDDVQKAVGIYSQQYAGLMSTFGHAERNTKGVTRLPFSKHYRVYHINEQVASMAIEALDRVGA